MAPASRALAGAVLVVSDCVGEAGDWGGGRRSIRDSGRVRGDVAISDIAAALAFWNGCRVCFGRRLVIACSVIAVCTSGGRRPWCPESIHVG